MSAHLFTWIDPVFSLIKVYVTFNFTAYFFLTSYLLFQEGISSPFQGFPPPQFIELDVPAIIKRTASGCKWPYLVRMNIHLFK